MPALRGVDLIEALLLRIPEDKWRRMELESLVQTGTSGDPEIDDLMARIRSGEADRPEFAERAAPRRRPGMSAAAAGAAARIGGGIHG